MGAVAGGAGTTTIFDRSYTCAIPPEYPGGPPTITVSVSPRRTLFDDVRGAGGGAGISRGGYGGDALFSINTGPWDSRQPNGFVLLNPRVCTARRRPLPLSRRGLSGPPVLFEQYLECPVTRRIAFRVRAPLDRTPRFRVSDGNRIATVNFSEATFVVALERAGAAPRPVAFATIASNGTTRFFSSPRCE